MGTPQNTKERLMHAASGIFAEKGYRETTVAEICEAAEANIAAVNYHYGDKLNLYREVWAFLFKEEAVRQPIPEDFDEIGDEAWLRLFIRARIENIMNTGFAGQLPRLLHREMAEPTDMHEEIFETHLKPNHERVKAAVQHLLGPNCTEEQIKLAVHNFMGLYIFLNVGHQKFRNQSQDNGHDCRLPRFEDSVKLSRQVEAFAMGGLLATRDLVQSSGLSL